MHRVNPFKGFDVEELWRLRNAINLTDKQQAYLYRILRGGTRLSSTGSKQGRSDWDSEKRIIAKYLLWARKVGYEDGRNSALG